MRHPGLLHVYIHKIEMCPYPAEAFKRCDVLSVPVPDAGRFQKYQRRECVLWSLLKRFELERSRWRSGSKVFGPKKRGLKLSGRLKSATICIC